MTRKENGLQFTLFVSPKTGGCDDVTVARLRRVKKRWDTISNLWDNANDLGASSFHLSPQLVSKRLSLTNQLLTTHGSSNPTVFR
jgi:hypothetical protein